MVRVISFLLVFSGIASAWGATCPKGKVFSRKQLRCVRVTRYMVKHKPLCPRGKIRVKGKCTPFPYKILTYKVPFVEKLKGLTLPKAALTQLKTGLPLYKNRRFTLAKTYLRRAYQLFPHEVLGHMLGECYRRNGEYYYASSLYASLSFQGKDPALKKLAGKLAVRIKSIRSELLRCRRNKKFCATALALLLQEGQDGYHVAEMMRVFFAERLGLAASSASALKKMCYDGHMKACVGYTFRLKEKKHHDALRLRYLKIACDGDEIEGCNALSDALVGKKRYVAALKLLKQGCRLGYEQSCSAIGQHIAKKLSTSKQARAFLTKECQAGPRRGGPIGNADWVNPQACMALGNVEANYLKKPKKATGWFKKACALGHTRSCMDLGDQLKDSSRYEAISAYRKACSAGVAKACKQAGLLYAKAQNYREALVWYDKYAQRFSALCRAGDKQSCSTLVKFFGETVKSVSRQRPWATQLAKLQENDCGPLHLSSCLEAIYTYGRVLKDSKKVCSLAKVLCTAKNTRGCHKVAECGITMGTIKPGSLGDPYYTLLTLQCDAGNFRSCNDCGTWMQKHGNMALALKSFKSACTGGFGEGCFNVGRVYETTLKKGRLPGIWYMKGCRLKHSASCSYAEYYYRRMKESWNLRQVWRVQGAAEKEKCTRKSFDSCLRAASYYRKANDTTQAKLLYEKALKHFGPRCAKGKSDDCIQLGSYLEQQKDTVKQSIFYYKKACALKNLYGCYRYGTVLLRTEKKTEGLRVLKRACAQKNAQSCYYLKNR